MAGIIKDIPCFALVMCPIGALDIFCALSELPVSATTPATPSPPPLQSSSDAPDYYYYYYYLLLLLLILLLLLYNTDIKVALCIMCNFFPHVLGVNF